MNGVLRPEGVDALPESVGAATARPACVTSAYTLQCIARDARRYARWHASPGFWVTLAYRVRRLRKYGGAPWRLLLPLDIVLGLLRGVLCDTIIPSSIPVGPGLYLPHPNGIILNAMAAIGADVAVFQQVTLGEWHGRAPVIGDGAALYAGAKLIGGVIVGRQCKIGANVVVTEDVADFSSLSVGQPVLRTRSGATGCAATDAAAGG